MNCPACGFGLTRPLTTKRKIVKGYDHQMIYRHVYRECPQCSNISYIFNAYTDRPIRLSNEAADSLRASSNSPGTPS